MKIIKDIGSIGIADITATAIGSIFWLYLASLLTADDYGEIQFILSIAGMAFAFSMIGTRNSIVVYEAKKIELRRTLFTISIIGGIGVSIILLILYQRVDVIIITFGMIFSELAFGYFLGKKLFVKYGIFIILQKVLMISLAIGLYFTIGVEGILYGLGLSYIPLIVIAFKNLKETKYDFKLFKRHSGFIINNYSLIIFGNAKGNLDKILIAPLVGFAVLGNYSLAFQVYLVMMVFTNIIYKYSLPNHSSGTISIKFKIITTIISIGFALIGMLIVPQIIPIYFPNFTGAVEAIPILSLAVIPNTISLLYSSKFLGAEKSRYILIGSIINLGTYLPLILFLGETYLIQGISISYLISSIVYCLFLAVMDKKQK